ncbi:MAG: hypothetical protein WCO77_11905, partial [bacterium]
LTCRPEEGKPQMNAENADKKNLIRCSSVIAVVSIQALLFLLSASSAFICGLPSSGRQVSSADL